MNLFSWSTCIANNSVNDKTQLSFTKKKSITVVVPKCFIKHVCFIVLYFDGHAFFSLENAKKCFFVLYFWKNVLYFKLCKWMEFLFQVFIYNTKIGKLQVTFLRQVLAQLIFGKKT